MADYQELINIIAVLFIIGLVISTEKLLLGIIALLLLRILDTLIDIKISLENGTNFDGSD